jgi:hypothetical protein
MTTAYPDEPGIDPDKWEESPIPDRDNDDEDTQGIGDEELTNQREGTSLP